MKKKFLSILLALTMCLSLLPTMAWATDFTNGWTKIGAGTSTLSGGSYYLDDNVTLTSNLTVNGDVTLDLNGYVLKGTGTGSVITVPSGATLTLEDSSTGKTHKFTPNESGLWELNETSGTKSITGGCITGGNADSGGGVNVSSNGAFTMTGGNIVGNTAASFIKGGSGGGVNVSSFGTFTMTGGSIANNTAKDDGGGVYCQSGTVTLGGTAKITGNTAGDVGSKTTNNLHLNSASVAISTETEPEDGMFVGVTMKEAQTNESDAVAISTTGVTKDYTPYFFSDNPVYAVTYKENALELIKSWPKLQSALNGTTEETEEAVPGLFDVEDGTITLLTDFKAVTGDKTLEVKGTKTLDLNGHVIDGAGVLKDVDGTKTGSVITVSKDAELTLEDSGNTAHYFTVGDNGLWTLNEATGTHTVTGGCITGGNGSQAGGVLVEQGNPAGMLTMKGGNIVGNTSTGAGGGVYLQTGSTFDMEGGSIIGNITGTGKTGGGVGLTSAKFTMTGGKIEYNVAASGGGVYSNNGTFTMRNGEINNNTATGYGMGGGVGIGNGTFTMTGGKISGNNATSMGGGVYYYNGTVTLGGTAQITGNHKGTGQAAVTQNVYLPNGKTITLGTNENVPASDMSVGVTTETAPAVDAPVDFANTVDASLIKYFFSDSDSYYVNYFATGSALQLAAVTGSGNVLNTTQGKRYDGFGKSGATGTVLDIAHNGDTLKLLDNVTTNETIEIGKPLTLDLNGKVLKGTGEGSVITVNSGSLTLIDTNPTAEHKFKDSETTTGLWVLDEDEGTKTVKGGCITGGTGTKYGDDTYGGGVYVYGTFTMNGGNIVGNAAEYGGGVFVEGSFDMTGGNIVGNSGYYGGGVYNKGTFTMNAGSTIGYNFAYWQGGGVCNSNKFTMTGGAIKSNSVGNEDTGSWGGTGIGGGVWNGYNLGTGTSGTFNMNGGTIEDCTAQRYGGGVDNYETFTMSGNAMITGCKAILCGGGGIENDHGAFEMSGSAQVTGCTAASAGGILYDGGTVTLGGSAKITGNTLSDGTTANNLWIKGNSDVVTLDAPTEAMSVGVTLASDTGVFSGVNGADYSARFTPDAGSDYKVISRADDYKLELVMKYAVNVADGIQNGTVTTNVTKAFEGDAVTVTVTPDEGYQLKALKYNDGTDHDITNAKSFTMPAANVTVTAEFEEIPAPSGGGSSTPTVNVPVSGDKDSVKVTATVSGGNATVKNVTSEQLETVGTGENVTIDLSSLSKSVSGVTIPKTTFENVAASEADGLEVKLPNGTTAVFDSTTVAAVAEQATGSNIQLVVDKESKAEQALTAAQKETVKELNDALVLDAYFVSNGKRISDFKGGEAELTVSYPTTKPVRVWYVAADGTMELVPSTFDGKSAKFVVTHFSHYAIEILDGSSYASCPQDATCPIEKFTDTENNFWWHDGIHYCLDNGLMNGVADAQFAPSGTLTRGMVVTMLWRLDGQRYPDYYMTFKDVPTSEWYTEAVRWAAAEKIVSGYDAEHFGPNDPVTREQLATILYNYAKYKGQGFTGSWMFLLDFVDRASISSWADEAVHWCSMKSIVTGKDGKLFDPQGTATRAEAASMVQRCCEALEK